MKILAFDLSTHSTGYAFGQDGQLKQHGYFTSSSRDVEQRIIDMRYKLISLICNFQPDKIIIQQVRPQINSHTNKVLMWLQGIVVITTYECWKKCQIQFINTSEWRAAIKIHQGRGVKRNEVKLYDIQYVKNKYKIDVNDDEADAICIFDSYWLKNDSNEINFV